jgi:amino acid adenylation domain-containing protein
MNSRESMVDYIIAADQFEKEKQYWLDKLQGELVKPHFPYDYPLNNNEHLQQEHQHIDFRFTREIDSRLLSIANNSEIRLFMLLVAGLLVLLHKYTGKKDIMIGSPILKQEVHGDFVNTMLILKHRLEDKTNFKELMYIVKQTLVEASKNQNYPITSLTRELDLEPAVPGDGNPFFDCIILLENIHDKSYIPESSSGMIFSFAVEQQTLHGCIGYNAALYDERTIKRISRHYRQLFRHILFNSELPLVEMPILSEDEKKQLLVEFNNNHRIPADFNTVVDWFEHQVEKTPGNIAAVYEDQEIDYMKLNQKANQLARALIRKGVHRDTITALMFTSSLEMIVSILAVLKTGGAYLPISGELPETRIKYIIEDSRAKHLVISKNLTEIQPFFAKNLFNGEIFIVNNQIEDIYHDEYNANIGIKYEANALAYVIYTSGTTGLPKGVLIEHKGIFNYINWRYHAYGCSEKDVTLQLLSYSFDGFMSNFYSSLLSGGTLVMIPDLKMLDFNYIIGLIKDKKVTNTSIVPRIFDIILQYAQEEDLKSLRFVILAGEKAEKKLVEKIKEKNADIILVNEYGPTEASVTAAANKSMNKSPTSVVGKPIANTKIFIFNGTFDIVPIGVPGELYIAGPGVARGYLNHPGLTREKFPEDPFEKGTVIYRTGDSARWLPDGNIEFKGRMDFQVKIRGFRIELEEIEQQLLNHKNISEAVVTACEDSGGSQYLCAYIVPDAEVNIHELREYLSVYFPDYMIPAYFVSMEKLPLSSNGKVDRKRLPEPELSVSIEKYTAPRDNVEKQLVEIWANVLGSEKDTIGIDSNFFALGGHSLTATILANQVHKELDVKIPMIEIFESPFIRNMAEYIKSTGKELFTAVEPAEARQYYPTSSAQNRLFIVNQLEPDATAYNVYVFVQLEGKLEIERLEQAFLELIHRHDSLRTSFEMIEGNPVQRVHQPAEIVFKVKYDPTEGENLETTPEEKTRKFIQPFDLSRAPLLRVELCKINPLKQILMVDMHHIITDGISLVILVEEFLALYNHIELPPMQLQYKDFSTWQQSPEMRERMKKQEKYWLQQFENEIPILDMLTDYPRPKIQSFEGAGYFFEVSREQAAGLNQLARSQGATLFMVLLGIFNILLSKVSSQQDIVVGTPVAGRRHAEIEKIIGIFINMLPLRNHVDGEKTFVRFLNDLKPGTLEAFENQDYQYADLVENLDLERDMSRNPLFDVVFILQNIYDTPAGRGEKEVKGLKTKPVTHEHRSSQFDLSLQATEAQNSTLTITVEYCTRLFRQETIARLMKYFQGIISSVIRNPGKKIADIEIISQQEKNQLLYEFNDTEAVYPRDKTIHELFADQVEQNPDCIALLGENPKFEIRNSKHQAPSGQINACGEENAITYRELNEKSHILACGLQEKGVGPDTIVALMMERTIDMIISIMAVLKAGGAYLPIDPDYPQERINYMLVDSKVNFLVKNSNNIGDLRGEQELFVLDFEHFNFGFVSNFDIRISDLNASNLAYIIYTSGTMGRPKGSLIEHRNVVRLLFNDRFQFDFTAQDTWTLFHSYCFDFSVWEMYGALLKGGRLVQVSKQTARDPERFLQVLRLEQVTVLNSTPAAFYQLVQQEMQQSDPGLRLRYVIFGGDALNPSRLKPWKEKYPQTKLINMYGITETTVHVTYKEIHHREIQSTASNIGGPIPTLTTYILSASPHREPVPIGVAGEICVGGEGVCRGYLNRPELTAERFIKSSFRQAERLYRSGDLGRYCDNGDIEYLGRIDHQVKIRGYRIELEEIIYRLQEHEKIKDAVVFAREKQNADKYLCAYIVSEHSIDLSELRDFSLKRLPEYMVPSYFILLDRIPMTANGKIDRKALPAPEIKQDESYVSPRNEIEEKMVDIWSEVLGIEKNGIGIDSDFFELGGHSLTATIMVGRIHQEFNVKLPLVEVFETSSIRMISEAIKQLSKDKFLSVQPTEKKEYYAPSLPQMRLYIAQQMEPQSTVYNIPQVVELQKTDSKRLKETLEKLIKRHENLRTGFQMVGSEPIQKIYDDVEFEIEFYDVGSRQGAAGSKEKIIRDFLRPFDLAKAPLLRVGLIRQAQPIPSGHLLLVDMHHIISDAVSQKILIEDFTALYEGEALPPLRLHYKDYSQWHNSPPQQKKLKKQKKFWLKEFEGEVPVLNFPTDYQVPAIQSFEGSISSFTIEKKETTALQQLAADAKGTLYLVLLSIYYIFLSKISTQQDIVIGTTTAGRGHADLEKIIGMFVNMIALRNYPQPEMRFTEFLQEVKKRTFEAFENQDYPFEELVKALALKKTPGRHPLFDAALNLQDKEPASKDGQESQPTGNTPDTYLSRYRKSRFALGLSGEIVASHLWLLFEYSTRFFKPDTIERFIGYFKEILSQVLENKEIKLQDIKISLDLITTKKDFLRDAQDFGEF